MLETLKELWEIPIIKVAIGIVAFCLIVAAIKYPH